MHSFNISRCSITHLVHPKACCSIQPCHSCFPKTMPESQLHQASNLTLTAWAHPHHRRASHDLLWEVKQVALQHCHVHKGVWAAVFLPWECGEWWTQLFMAHNIWHKEVQWRRRWPQGGRRRTSVLVLSLPFAFLKHPTKNPVLLPQENSPKGAMNVLLCVIRDKVELTCTVSGIPYLHHKKIYICDHI